jgi:hypothetical protein
MASFLLLLHDGAGQFSTQSPEETMAIVKEYMAWSERLRKDGKYLGSNKLTDEPGKVLRPKNGRVVVTDGPYAETKELIGGYYCISAADYDEACRIAESCPQVKYGGHIEVRQIHDL